VNQKQFFASVVSERTNHYCTGPRKINLL